MFPAHYRLVSQVPDYTEDEAEQLNNLTQQRAKLDAAIVEFKANAVAAKRMRMTTQYQADKRFLTRLLPASGIPISANFCTNGDSIWDNTGQSSWGLISYCNHEDVMSFGARILWELHRVLLIAETMIRILSHYMSEDIAWILAAYDVEICLVEERGTSSGWVLPHLMVT